MIASARLCAGQPPWRGLLAGWTHNPSVGVRVPPAPQPHSLNRRLAPMTYDRFAYGPRYQSGRSASLIQRSARCPTAPGRLSQGPPTVGSMPPLPRITGRELVRALGKQRWVVVVQKGSHAQLKHPSCGGRVTVPLHAGRRSGPACSARS
jgi:predicted RNA binding protein YcfA (HicA-like mRNA interferase family)